MKKKLLIEVGDDIDLDFLRKNCKTGGLIVDPVPECRAIADGKVLSDMTNGDVMRIIFPNLKELNMVVGDESEKNSVGFGTSCFSVEWWNAPYKRAEG